MGRPHRLAVLWRSTIGKKLIMAVTGLILVLALLGRLTPRDRLAMGIISAVLTVIIAAQVWIGILLLYDGGDGPLAHFK